MERYLVEGLYFPKPTSKKTKPVLEPFARSYWANSAQEAIQMATEDLQGGNWQKAPRASQTSEEQRMRQSGQPELPGLGSLATKKPDSGGKRASTRTVDTRKKQKTADKERRKRK